MTTSTQTSTTSSPWPVSQSQAITVLTTNDTDLKLEPSGLTIWVDSNHVSWLYLVSDNGKIARRKLDLSDSWHTQSYPETKEYDFESVTVAKGELMIGVEGGDPNGSPTYAHIERFDPNDTTEGSLGSFTKSKWILKNPTPGNNAGMEAMTFVPDGAYPSSWGTSSYYGGLFFASFQSEPGKVYVYDLPQGNGQSHNVNSIHSFTSPLLNMKVSDMYYSAQLAILYVLYDDTTGSLQELVLNTNKTGYNQKYQTTPPYVGCEAVAQNGTNLYLGLDQNGSQMNQNHLTTNYVFEYPGFTNHQ
jgi:hypothetical protein